MDTIKNYLEGMFARLPGSPEVMKAKKELYQMMEDKYNELIAEGKSDNEAVGIVISEFGNLDELAEDLGINEVKAELEETECYMVERDEAVAYVNAKRKRSIIMGLGIFLCINCVCGPIMASVISKEQQVFGVLVMFLMIAVGVVTIVYSNIMMRPYSKFLQVPARLEYVADTYIREERERYVTSHALRLTGGILLCCLCWLPCMVADELFSSVEILSEGLAPVFLFVFVGSGVLLIVQTNSENNAYEKLLSLNYGSPMAREKRADGRNVPDYKNKTVDIIMHVFWPTVTCIYLIWSFLTFNWFISWIVWPIGGVVFGMLKTVFRDYEVR